MDNPEEILFSGAKIGKDVSPEERRQREKEKRERRKAQGGLGEKPQRPTGPPEETDAQRRLNSPFQDRNNLFGTGDTARARGDRRRARVQARREARDRFTASQAPAPAPAPAPAAPRNGRRPLRPKPQRPS